MQKKWDKLKEKEEEREDKIRAALNQWQFKKKLQKYFQI